MPPSIRGHQGSIKVFKDGGDTSIVNITSANVQQKSSFKDSAYVGERYVEKDQTQEGWTGDMDLEVKGPEVDDFIDALVNSNLNGIGVSNYSVVMTENYGDGRTRSYVYFNMVFKMSKKNPALTEKVTKRLEWEAAGRLPL